jgi:uncharacterized membrane protein
MKFLIGFLVLGGLGLLMFLFQAVQDIPIMPVVLSVVFVILPVIIAVVVVGKRKKAKQEQALQREKRVQVSNDTGFSYATPTPQTHNSADDIAKYKSLLDSGVITQEEFDTKKKQLLGL